MKMKFAAPVVILFAFVLTAFADTADRAAERDTPELSRPNIIFILVDDMGYSDVGCYGSEIQTPHIDSLAETGLRYTQIYNTAKCFPSRAALLTGVYPQQCGVSGPRSKIRNAVTLGEVLQSVGYRTFVSGKHHGGENLYHRGFDHYYGLRDGCSNFWNPGNKRDNEPAPARKTVRHWCDDDKEMHPFTPEDKDFYTTDAFTDKALEWLDEKELQQQPFFLYLSYTAPHYPLHAWPEDIAKYEGVYDAGYTAIQKARYEKMVAMQLIDPAKAPLQQIDDALWAELEGVELAKEIRRMEIYAAMVDRVDQNIGRVLAKLRQQGKLDDTLIMFASDNGACPGSFAEDSGRVREGWSTRLEDFGKVNSYQAVGKNWATVQNTPLRKWKDDSFEGGIRTPFIVSWPERIKNVGAYNATPGHFIDIMATLTELTGAEYPDTFMGQQVVPMQGISLLPTFAGQVIDREQPIYWHYYKGGGVRNGKMKAVFHDKVWELYDMSQNHNETDDLAEKQPELLRAMQEQWKLWLASVKRKPGQPQD